MFPLRRLALAMIRASRMPALSPGDSHVDYMHAMPWDIDPFGDLNNGRIVTLSDVGRVALAKRSGLLSTLKKRRWGFAMAGSTPQYRRRITMFEPLELHSRLIGRDQKFFYIEHNFYVRSQAAANIMCRTVITSKGRLVSTDEVAQELGRTDWNPPLPDWVKNWAAADDQRPWPPTSDLPTTVETPQIAADMLPADNIAVPKGCTA
ncbi:MAG: thioesterase family protein [Pikeienuella sp.]